MERSPLAGLKRTAVPRPPERGEAGASEAVARTGWQSKGAQAGLHGKGPQLSLPASGDEFFFQMNPKQSQRHRTAMKPFTVRPRRPWVWIKTRPPGRAQKQTWRSKVRVGPGGAWWWLDPFRRSWRLCPPGWAMALASGPSGTRNPGPAASGPP